MSKVNIYQGQVPDSATALVTATKTQTIDAAVVCNTSASSVTLQVWIVIDGGSTGDDHKIYDALSVDADSETSLALLINHAIPAGAKLFAQASAATSLTLTISGRE